MTDVFYVDGQFITGQTASIPISDLGFTRGYGVFDFTRTYHKQPWYLAEHVARLLESARALDLDVPFSAAHIINITGEALALSTHAECYIRIIITGGDGITSLLPAGKPRLVVSITRAVPFLPEKYEQGIKAITIDEPRYLPGVKCLNYIPAVRAMQRARSADALEALYVDKIGNVYEGTTSNVFAFIDGALVTPPLSGVLRGITRDIVMDLARAFFPVREEALQVDSLYRADEIFLTSTTMQIMPVTRADDLLVRDGKPGDNTRKLMACFEALVEK
ncbi:MAG: amino acid aminotransferase [Anaerolineaceae bacterium]|nr:MAG: amino acid aminotransferase [Anaerolineaceae bacterium]